MLQKNCVCPIITPPFILVFWPFFILLAIIKTCKKFDKNPLIKKTKFAVLVWNNFERAGSKRQNESAEIRNLIGPKFKAAT